MSTQNQDELSTFLRSLTVMARQSFPVGPETLTDPIAQQVIESYEEIQKFSRKIEESNP